LIQKRKAVDPKSTISFKILPDNKNVSASQGTTILKALRSAKIEIASSCDGMGTCGTCRVFVENGLEKLGPRNEIENEFAQERSFKDNERLSCQCLVQEGLVLRKP
jgi:ferredoxin